MKTEKEICDLVKSYEDACVLNDEKPMDEFAMEYVGFTKAEIALRKLEAIGRALNQSWKADWNDSGQQKWFPWFRVSPSGFSFLDTNYYCSHPSAGFASRLCFVSDETAAYAGKQFIELYKIAIL